MADQSGNLRPHSQKRQAEDSRGTKERNDPTDTPMSTPMIPGDTEATARHKPREGNDPRPFKADKTAGSE